MKIAIEAAEIEKTKKIKKKSYLTAKKSLVRRVSFLPSAKNV